MLLIKFQLILLVQKFSGTLVHEKSVCPFLQRNIFIIWYLSGYVFETFYKQLRPPKSNSSSYYQQLCLSFLMTGKCSGENLSLPEHKHIEILDGGGL